MKNLSVFSDEPLQQVTGQIIIGQTILVAYDLGLFKTLVSSPLSIMDLANALDLSPRAVQAMLSCACTLKLVENHGGLYQLSDLGHSFFDPRSSTYYGPVFDLLIEENHLMSFSKIKEALLSNTSQVNHGIDLFAEETRLGSSPAFVAGLHHKALAAAFFWPDLIDLTKHSIFVDIGGGSGIHTISTCLKNPQLHGIVCDRPSILSHTDGYIESFNLQKRIKTEALDMWKDPFPHGDLLFLADIFHDWEEEKCLLLARKCFSALPSKGKIILHEMLFNEEKTGPLLTAAYNMKMLLWTKGTQYSFSELQSILKIAGFEDITKVTALGNWSLVSGVKP